MKTRANLPLVIFFTVLTPALTLAVIATWDSQGVVVRLEFYDNGAAINRKDIQRVFDRFFTTRRDSGGTSLELSISFGATITVSTEGGRNTRCKIELPVVAQAEHQYV